MPDFLERLKDPRPILMDGATGTELERRGVETSSAIWSAMASFDTPSLLENIHREYIEVGAEIITANTFRSQRRAMQKVGRGADSEHLTQAAVDIARKAVQESGRTVFVAGSMAPLEDCYSPQLVPPDNELRREHAEMANSLAAVGVDLLFVETMNTVREAAAAAEAAKTTGLPFGVSFVCRNDGRLLSGESITDAVAVMETFEPNFLSVNCTPAQSLGLALEEMAIATKRPIAAYGNNGHSDDFADWEVNENVGPQEYARLVATWQQQGASLLGGCCGTTPDHIAAIQLVDKITEQ